MNPDESNELHASGAFYASFLPPRLTAIIPHYNHADVLPRALAALKASSRPPDEIIVVDDGSEVRQTFKASEVCEAMGARFFPTWKNRGVPSALNYGIQRATGNLLYFGSADDEVFTNFFEQAINTIQCYPAVGVVAGMGEWVDIASGKRIVVGYPHPAKFEPDAVADKFVPNHVAIYRRSTQVLFDPEAGPFSDWLLAQIVTQQSGACFTGAVGGRMNLRGDSYYRRNQDAAATYTIFKLRDLGLLDRVNIELLGWPAFDALSPKNRTLKRWLRFVWRDCKSRTWRKLPQFALDAIGTGL